MLDFPADRVEDLVAELGAPWHIAPDPFDGHAGYRRFVSDGRGRAFWLSMRSRPAPDGSPRLRATGRYPDVPGYYEDRERPRPCFSLGRSLETLGRDVGRRFLAPYDAAFGRAVDAVHARAVAGGGRAEFARALLEQFSHPGGHFTNLPREGLTVHLRLLEEGDADAKVETRDDMAKVSLALTGLTRAQVHLVLEALKDKSATHAT